MPMPRERAYKSLFKIIQNMDYKRDQ